MRPFRIRPTRSPAARHLPRIITPVSGSRQVTGGAHARQFHSPRIARRAPYYRRDELPVVLRHHHAHPTELLATILLGNCYLVRKH